MADEHRPHAFRFENQKKRATEHRSDFLPFYKRAAAARTAENEESNSLERKASAAKKHTPKDSTGSTAPPSPATSSVYSSRSSRSTAPTSVSSVKSERPSKAPQGPDQATKDLEAACVRYVQSTQVIKAVKATPSTAVIGSKADDGDPLDIKYGRLFRSVCVCDVNIPGQPIQSCSRAFSKEPSRHLQVGRCRFLNFPPHEKVGRTGCSLYSRREPHTLRHIMDYVMPMVNRTRGEVEYLLAAQLDVTEVVKEIAKDALEKEQRANSKDKVLSTASSIDWIALAKEYADEDAGLRQPPKKTEAKPSPDLQREFGETVLDLRHLHQYAFVLSLSAYSESWQMCWVSKALYEKSQDDLAAGLKLSDPAVLETMGQWFAGANEHQQKIDRSIMTRASWYVKGKDSVEAFATKVRWGVKGVEKWLYAVPTYRPGDEDCHRWVCFLVDASISCFWG